MPSPAKRPFVYAEAGICRRSQSRKDNPVVWQVTHGQVAPYFDEDIKFIGIFSTKKNAQAAVAYLKARPGFHKPGGRFFIDPYRLDEIWWNTPRLASHPDLVHATTAGDTLTVAGGKLVAVDHGEWGGALEFWPALGLPHDLIKDNATAVLRSGRGIFVTTGSWHGGLDNGFIYRIAQDTNGRWNAERIWRLPGAPARVLHTPQGTMGIYTNYGDVIFRPDSGMEWISCRPRE